MTVTLALVSPDPLYITSSIQMQATFRNALDLCTDPTTITLRHHDPSGNITTSTYNAAGWGHPSTGAYTFDLDTDEAGTWQYSFAGTGAVDAYGEGSFVVFAKGF